MQTRVLEINNETIENITKLFPKIVSNLCLVANLCDAKFDRNLNGCCELRALFMRISTHGKL